MTALQFGVEWEEAPRVCTPELSTTWARLEIQVEGQAISNFFSKPAHSIRSGVYGSVFPLARWVVRNWWSLLHEGIRNVSALRGAHVSRIADREWLQRHNMMLAREGHAYPDLSILREDDGVVLRWVADPPDVTTPGRFIEDGSARISRADAEEGLARFVESVLERTTCLNTDAISEMNADWAAIQESNRSESTLCARLAALGLDPYSAHLTEDTIELLSGSVAMPEHVVRDILAASTDERLVEDLELARLLLKEVQASPHHYVLDETNSTYDPRPYLAGCRRAARVRQTLGLSPEVPVLDLESVIKNLVGTPEESWLPANEQRSIDAVVERNSRCVLAATKRMNLSKRFLLARALHHWQFVTRGEANIRLLTRGNDWQQSASRAFAAELLAPAAALASRMSDDRTWEQPERLAEAFQVSEFVIAHQIENHGLA